MGNPLRLAALALAAASAFAAAAPLRAEGSGSKALGKAKRALGWDAMNLKVVERDSAGRPELEKDENAANVVERKTGYHSNGTKASQSTVVVSKEGGKTLYTEKKSWDELGRLEESFVQDDAYGKDGRQVRGESVEKRYEEGRLAREVKKRYSAETGSWGTVYRQSLEYHGDGDLKERVTENPPEGEKTRETWSGREGALGRKKTTQSWNGVTKEWE